MANNTYSFDNLDTIDWFKIMKNYPNSFEKYMSAKDLESFMIACNCIIEVNYYLNNNDDVDYWETRVECKENAINVIGLHTFGETKIKTIEILFELIEKQMLNDGFKRN